MCGICGFVGHGDETALDHMLRRLRHRGPDEEGRYTDPAVMLGVRRLRVIDPAGGHQPVSNETGTIRVVLNGEIYNYQELREELIRKGHRFASNCDTEVLVHLYEQEGEEGVNRLRGMFAFALWDRERETLLLVRDRLGIKPLYYADWPGSAGAEPGLVFASELPALLAALSSRRVAPHALVQYLTFLYVPGPGTMFEGIRQLLPGELLRVAKGRIESRRYVQLDSVWHEARSATRDARREPREELSDRFLAVLRDTVRAHLVSDVPLGLFLSGGLDSAAILAMMRAVTNGPIRSFSIGYESDEDRSYDELPAARTLAAHFGAQHTEERLRPDVVKLLPEIVTAMGEPFADASAIPTYLVSQVARRSVTVALSGIGGDELFGGYPRYLGIRAAAAYARVPTAVRRWLGTRLAPRLPEGEGSRDQLGRLKRFLRDGHRPIADQYLRWITFLPAEWGLGALTPSLLEQAGRTDATDGHRAAFAAWPSQDPADQAMGLDVQTYLPDDLLRMGDRLSMAHSLELRVPFCDPELLALAVALPVPVRFAGWRLKGFMREALRGVVPAATLARSKFGFQVPLARWLRQELRDMTHDLLAEEVVRRRGYVNPAYVRWVLREHDLGRRNLADQLYALLVLELWLRSIEQN